MYISKLILVDSSMCMRTLNESRVSCFVQTKSPSAVSLLNMSVCPWL